MPDFAMDYEALYAMQRGLHSLAEKADSGGGTGAWEEVGSGTAASNEAVFGNYNLAYDFQLFYRTSRRRVDEGKEKLKRFGDMFGGVADGLFEQDAQIAAAAATAAANTMHDRWRQEHDAVEQWEQNTEEWNSYLRDIGADEYFSENPDANIWEVCAGEDAPDWCQTWRDDYSDRPVPPGERPEGPDEENPPSHLQFRDSDGATTDLWLTYDEDFNVVEEKATVVTSDGETFTTTVTYDGPPDMSEPDEDGNSFDQRDYTVTTVSPDGTTTVEHVEVLDDGSGTRSTGESTFLNDDDEEETETTVTESVTNDDGGQTMTSTTTDEDGNTSSTSTEVTMNDDGTQTRIITSTDEDGNTETTTYTREGPAGTWEEQEHTSDENGDGRGGDGRGGDGRGGDSEPYTSSDDPAAWRGGEGRGGDSEPYTSSDDPAAWRGGEGRGGDSEPYTSSDDPAAWRGEAH